MSIKKMILLSVAGLMGLILLFIVFSIAFFFYDRFMISGELGNLPQYYQNLGKDYCGRALPVRSQIKDCCVMSVKQMAENNAKLAPLAFTNDPTRGCGEPYGRLMCHQDDGTIIAGNLEWCNN